MTNEQRDIQRKRRVLQYAKKIGKACKACRYFGRADPAFIDGDLAIKSMVKPV